MSKKKKYMPFLTEAEIACAEKIIANSIGGNKETLFEKAKKVYEFAIVNYQEEQTKRQKAMDDDLLKRYIENIQIAVVEGCKVGCRVVTVCGEFMHKELQSRLINHPALVGLTIKLEIEIDTDECYVVVSGWAPEEE